MVNDYNCRFNNFVFIKKKIIVINRLNVELSEVAKVAKVAKLSIFRVFKFHLYTGRQDGESKVSRKIHKVIEPRKERRINLFNHFSTKHKYSINLHEK